MTCTLPCDKVASEVVTCDTIVEAVWCAVNDMSGTAGTKVLPSMTLKAPGATASDL